MPSRYGTVYAYSERGIIACKPVRFETFGIIHPTPTVAQHTQQSHTQMSRACTHAHEHAHSLIHTCTLIYTHNIRVRARRHEHAHMVRHALRLEILLPTATGVLFCPYCMCLPLQTSHLLQASTPTPASVHAWTASLAASPLLTASRPAPNARRATWQLT